MEIPEKKQNSFRIWKNDREFCSACATPGRPVNIGIFRKIRAKEHMIVAWALQSDGGRKKEI